MSLLLWPTINAQGCCNLLKLRLQCARLLRAVLDQQMLQTPNALARAVFVAQGPESMLRSARKYNEGFCAVVKGSGWRLRWQCARLVRVAFDTRPGTRDLKPGAAFQTSVAKPFSMHAPGQSAEAMRSWC